MVQFWDVSFLCTKSLVCADAVNTTSWMWNLRYYQADSGSSIQNDITECRTTSKVYIHQKYFLSPQERPLCQHLRMATFHQLILWLLCLLCRPCGCPKRVVQSGRLKTVICFLPSVLLELSGSLSGREVDNIIGSVTLRFWHLTRQNGFDVSQTGSQSSLRAWKRGSLFHEARYFLEAFQALIVLQAFVLKAGFKVIVGDASGFTKFGIDHVL